MILSVRVKLLLLVSSVFLIVTLASSVVAWKKSRLSTDERAIHQAQNLAEGHFDVLNTMMLTGVIANRGIAREKLLKYPQVLDVRAVRSQTLNNQYPPQNKEEMPRDALDQQALLGQQVTSFGRGENGRVLTYIQPAIADKRPLPGGITCLNCHAVPEHTVLGAVRIDYSLAELDQDAEDQIYLQLAVNLALFLLGALLMLLLINRLIIRPIAHMREGISSVRAGDLTQSLTTRSRDELGNMCEDLNTIIDGLRGELMEIQENALGLDNSSRNLNQVSEEMARKASSMRGRVNLVIAASDRSQQAVDLAALEAQGINGEVNQLARSANEVAQSMGRVNQVVQDSDTSIATLASSANQMNATLGQIAENTQQTRQETTRAVTSMAEAKSQMEALQTVTREIGQVVDSINEIAEVTQTLALNATIEAARAGSAGRGFGVVADQVRDLAKQTNQATEVIQRRVAAIQVSTLSAAAEIEKMGEVIDHVNRMVSGTAEALAQQTSGMQENHEHLTRTAEGMQDLAAFVRKTDAQIERIANQLQMIAERADRVAEQTEVTKAEFKAIGGHLHEVGKETSASAKDADQVNHLARRLMDSAHRLAELVGHYRTRR